jgi:hypothetical protein
MIGSLSCAAGAHLRAMPGVLGETSSRRACSRAQSAAQAIINKKDVSEERWTIGLSVRHGIDVG